MEPRNVSQRQHHGQQRRMNNIGNRHSGGEGRAVPAWERRFCAVVGRMSWRYFLTCKEYISCGGSSRVEKIMRWDDSAGLECFRAAKASFYAENYSGRCGTRLELRVPPRRDLYIDDIVWRGPNDDGDCELRRLVAEADEAHERARAAAARNDWVFSSEIPLEEIKATGWDDDVVGYSSWQNPTLTGMIVGGGDGNVMGPRRRRGGREGIGEFV